EPTRRARNLLPRAVIEGDDQRESVIAAGQVFRLLQQPANIGIEIVAFADDADADIVLVQIDQIVADEAAQQPEQIADFRRRARPVFRAEGENRQDGNAELVGRAHRLAQGLDAAAMPLHARQAAAGGPASIAIHDDGDMAGTFEAGAAARLGVNFACRAQTVMISFSLPASIFSTSAMVASVAFCTSPACRFSSSSLILCSFSSFFRRSRPSRRT